MGSQDNVLLQSGYNLFYWFSYHRENINPANTNSGKPTRELFSAQFVESQSSSRPVLLLVYVSGVLTNKQQVVL